MKIDFTNKRVTLMGLGLFGGGVGAARFLIQRGASVTVTDLRSDQVLAESLKALKGLPITFRLGEHREADFREADVVVVSPAVPKNSPFLKMAREAGTTVVARDNLIFQWCPAPIMGVTGSNGKTTTVSLIGAMFRRVHPETVVGGNIGGSVLDRIEKIHADTPVILELSSFQLEDLQEIGMNPHVAVVTNLSPNHLDRHGTFEEYVRAKKGIIRYQKPDDVAILNYDDPAVRLWAGECPGKVVFFSLREPLREGVFVQNGRIVVRLNFTPLAPQRPQRTQRKIQKQKRTLNSYESSAFSACSAVRSLQEDAEEICGTEELILPGRHNVENALAATAAAWIGGVGKTEIAGVLRSFEGVAHRLEFVREIQGVRYYNDSIATTPESVIAALDSFEGGIVLIAGGSDKGISFDHLADEIVRKAKAVVLIGTTASKISALVEVRRAHPPVMRCNSLEEAVRHAKTLAQSGDVVLLSPACASYDMFRNFEDRGNRFKALVERL
ncbi:MAG: UDP-N-acetylmuramoyl-L-alanine--D-glutamate ligase [Candidatus Latescibacterota bacterium]|nr:MAG: UDP-N-acetylmuramoyl-L-alanine--D-glutamate ligase [Candidatus Latescibacterota bacterium]